MGLEDSYILGQLSDEIDADESASEVNERSLFQYNQSQVLGSLNKRISKYELKFLLKEIKDSNDEFWALLLRSIIKTYSLNSLKPYLSEGFEVFDIRSETIKLLIFIKSLMMTLIDNGDIDENSNRRTLEGVFNDAEVVSIVPFLMKKAMMYIDNESFKAFLSTVVKESKKEYKD